MLLGKAAYLSVKGLFIIHAKEKFHDWLLRVSFTFLGDDTVLLWGSFRDRAVSVIREKW
jgi:hypothetical protein